MSDIAIRVEHLTKQYRIGQRARYKTARESLTQLLSRVRALPKARNGASTFLALDDVSFDVDRGEVLGIIGRNGAGKSTLLKVLSRITEPTTGRIEINGRIGSLLEVGTGFHPELTGRENVYLNGAILGMRQSEIAAKFDEIVSFAEIEKFLDTQVKHYSSGMYTRLAFAVAAHLEPEILIVDEVLAVGDAEFQRKCMGRMSDVARAGRTVLFVSHNMGAIRALCNRAVLLEKGRVSAAGDVGMVLDRYLGGIGGRLEGDWKRQSPPASDAAMFFEEVSISGSNGSASNALDSNTPFSITITLTARQPLDDVQVSIRVVNQDGINVFTTANSDTLGGYQPLSVGKHVHSVEIPGRFLLPGKYTLLIGASTPNVKLHDIIDGEIGFTIEDMGNHATLLRDGRLGVVTPLMEWKIR